MCHRNTRTFQHLARDRHTRLPAVTSRAGRARDRRRIRASLSVMRASVLVLTLAACWRSTPPPSVTPAPASEPSPRAAAFRPSRSALTHEQRCARSLAAAFEVSRDELAGSGLAPDVVDEIEDAFVASCEVTQWTDEVVDCVGGVTGFADWSPCQNLMTQDQRDDSVKRAVEILQRRHALSSATAPSPTPPP